MQTYKRNQGVKPGETETQWAIGKRREMKNRKRVRKANKVARASRRKNR